MEQRYKVGDKVVKSWKPQSGTGVVEEVGILSYPEDVKLEAYIYRVKFPLCEGSFLEQDLLPAIITDQPVGDKIQS